jgi:carbon-monoxide dehydrogenase large subunit
MQKSGQVEGFGAMTGMDPKGFGIGQPVRRKEDSRLIVGRGHYSDDYNLPGQVYAAFARSPHAHARIAAIDSSEARAMPGVVAVFTGADVLADGLKPLPSDFAMHGTVEMMKALPDVILVNAKGLPHLDYDSPYPLLAQGAVRFVGEAVAVVLADTPYHAADAAEHIRVDYEPLASATATPRVADKDAAVIWDGAASNACFDCAIGDKAAADAAFASAAHVVRLDTWIQRVTGVPMEARSVTANYDAATGRYTVYAGSGGVVRQKREIAGVLGIAEDKVRVIAEDIGGNFGTKNSIFPEFPLTAWLSNKVGRPVKWTANRSEAFVSDHQGRDLVSHMELAVDANGKFLAMRGTNISNLGAYASSFIPLRKGIGILTGVYTIPVAYVHAQAVVSNTPATIPYRSAGRPEAMFILERLIDMAADKSGIDPIEIRRRNLIPREALPYTNATGVTYDNGEYERVMDDALTLAEWQNFAARKAEAKKRGKLRGIGVANYIELTMGFPREWSEVVVHPEGRVDVAVGTLSSGQGHETSFTQCVSEWLGVPFDKVKLVQGDTDRVPVGGGSHSGRSMRMAGVVMGKASQAVIARGRAVAAHVLDAPEANIDFADGRFFVANTNKFIGLFDVAQAANDRADLPENLRGKFSAEADVKFTAGGFPYGSHVAEVEIDPETGVVELVRYAAVDDVGHAINPLILHGQTHGGIVQGVGQALWEHAHYDPETGQLLTASFMDYVMPRADRLPSFDTGLSEVPSPSNPLGVRAGGEGGTTPALGVVINAVVDALSEFGVTHVEMPASAERVWRIIQDAKNSQGKAKS